MRVPERRGRPDRVVDTSGLATLLSLTPEDKAGLQILVVDDERTLRESCATVLEHDGYKVTICGRGEEALDKLKRGRFDIVLVDLYMSPVTGMDVLAAALQANRDTIVIVITGNPSVASSVEALRAGAWDYLPKPFSATHLQILLGRAAHTFKVARETRQLQRELERQHGNSEKSTVLGVSPVFRKAIELARKVAATDASVLLTGESGTGKELFAQFIHDHSRRSSRSLVAVNCAALPEPLLESEMFGHVRGAFTGAVRDKPGLLETANGGTLFLDELLEMPKSIQAKLLRVIQDGVVRRVGSEQTDAVVNVRFISATNREPEKAVQDQTLREDLYYRVRVVPIHIPPLRRRPEDIPLLAKYFLQLYWARHRGSEAPMPQLSDAALRALKAHGWPGNVRELQNVFEHAVVLLEPGSEVQPADIPFQDDGAAAASAAASAPAVTDGLLAEAEGMPTQTFHSARDRLLAEFERRYLSQLVKQAGRNMSRAARIAGVDRTTLYRLMDRHGLHRRSVDQDDDAVSLSAKPE
ncbi:MAG TPA: sigma-54 dependent transcriptional regulator [Gemmatimonadales bacterium]